MGCLLLVNVQQLARMGAVLRSTAVKLFVGAL
ncbi:hypothetical protein U128_01640 [Anaplasma marginale str. Gypsy Plains]|nr:hypothetical protein U128_01640 [Anaplasma marginale str. Gypsy Plains]